MGKIYKNTEQAVLLLLHRKMLSGVANITVLLLTIEQQGSNSNANLRS